MKTARTRITFLRIPVRISVNNVNILWTIHNDGRRGFMIEMQKSFIYLVLQIGALYAVRSSGSKGVYK
jgi:hypothetical protein